MSDQLELFPESPFALRLTIEEAMRIFWDNYWHRVASAKQTVSHRRRICLFFKGRFIDTISKNDIENYRYWMASNKLSPPTINKGHMLLARMFTKLQEYKEATEINGIDYRRIQLPSVNPCTQIKKVNEKSFRRKQICSPEVFKRLLYYADDDMTDKLIMYLETGLRGCDLERLTSKNVDLEHGILNGIQHKTITSENPSGVEYTLKITETMKDILLGRLSRVKPGTPLFPKNGWQKKWNALREQAGCKFIQRRDLRRTKATVLLNNGVDQLTVAESLGLTTARLVPNYAPRTLQHQAEGLEKLEKIYE